VRRIELDIALALDADLGNRWSDASTARSAAQSTSEWTTKSMGRLSSPSFELPSA
jgi:hypothetical protein